MIRPRQVHSYQASSEPKQEADTEEEFISLFEFFCQQAEITEWDLLQISQQELAQHSLLGDITVGGKPTSSLVSPSLLLQSQPKPAKARVHTRV